MNSKNDSLFNRLKSTLIKFKKLRKIRKVSRHAKKVHKKIKSLDVALVVVMVLFVLHSIEMFYLYDKYTQIPEQYAIAVVVALIGECGLVTRIFNVKYKNSITKDEDDSVNDDPMSSGTHDCDEEVQG